MPALSARMASRWVVASALALSVVYMSTGSSRSSRGAATARPEAITHAKTSVIASVDLTLKNLLLADRDRLAPPALVAGQRDVLTGHPGGGAFLVPHREENVPPGRE